MITRYSFRQCEVEQYRIGKAETRCKEEGNVDTPAAQYSADRWTKDESKAKRCADQSHALGAILFGSDVCNVSLGSRNIATSYAVKDSTCKEHPKRRGKS